MFTHKNLTIYPTPEIVFQDSKRRVFQKTALSPYWQCYRNTKIGPNKNADFRLLSWNIHKGADHGWERSLTELAEDKHFVLLQEATSAQRIPQRFARFENHLHIFAFRFQQRKTGVLNLSALNTDLYCASGLREPLLRLPKVMSAMRFPFENGRSLLMINVHLINFEWNSHQSYQQQLDALKALIQTHKGAVILAGDFNTWNKKRKNQLSAMLKTLNLTEVLMNPDERITAFGHPLDYIFTRNVRVNSAISHPVKSSDHNPLELDFSLK